MRTSESSASLSSADLISSSLPTSSFVSMSLLETARSFEPRICLVYEQIEADGRLPPALVKSLATAGFFRLLIPRAVGGLETDMLTVLEVFEEMAKVDGSVGWCTMIGATGGLVSAYLREDVAQAIYGSDPLVITGGALAPTGKAVAVDKRVELASKRRVVIPRVPLEGVGMHGEISGPGGYLEGTVGAAVDGA